MNTKQKTCLYMALISWAAFAVFFLEQGLEGASGAFALLAAAFGVIAIVGIFATGLNPRIDEDD